MNNNSDNWRRYYSGRIAFKRLYPAEWVVRVLAGTNYPQLGINKSSFRNARMLDLGCGDGRNLGLLQDLGFKVYATEISDETVASLKSIRQNMGWDVEFQRGINSDLPYEDGFFEYILSCWSFYYLEGDAQPDNVISEIARVLRDKGYFIGVIPDSNISILNNAELLEDGTMMIRNDPLNIRNETRWMVANSADEVRKMLNPCFRDIHIGHLADDYFGLVIAGFIFVCRKK